MEPGGRVRTRSSVPQGRRRGALVLRRYARRMSRARTMSSATLNEASRRIPDLPALTPERGSSTVSGNSARRYKIQTPVTPGLFRVPVRKRARQAVTVFGDDEAGGPEHRTFDLALDQKRDYRTLSSNTGKRRWCLANPPFVDRGGGLRPRPLGGRPRTVQQPGLSTPACRRTTPLQRLIERDLGRQRGGVARDRQRERRPTLRL